MHIYFVHTEADDTIIEFNMNGKKENTTRRVIHHLFYSFLMANLATFKGTYAHHIDFLGEGSFIDLHGHAFSLILMEGLIFFFSLRLELIVVGSPWRL